MNNKKIVTIEDITSIVGLKNYIDALSLDTTKIKYINSINSNNNYILSFNYDNNDITVTIDKNKNINDLKCNCSSYNSDYCKHIGAIMIHIMKNQNIIDNLIDNMKVEYDEQFNNMLFSELQGNIKKELIGLDVILRQVNQNSYELILKIGRDKKYVLKSQLDYFLDVYNNGSGVVSFGKNFTYDSSKHYFSDIDNEIIDFINLIFNIQNNGHSYYYKNNNIILCGKTLSKFMDIIQNKSFMVEKKYSTQKYDGIINNYLFDISLKKENDDISLDFDVKNIIPFIEDYSYIIYEDKMIKLDNDLKKIIDLMVQEDKKKIIFKDKDFSKISNILLPKLKKVNNNIITDDIKSIFVMDKPNIKLYFDYIKGKIFCLIKLEINNQEINIFEDNFNGIYVSRDIEEERDCINTLLGYNFKINEKKKEYILSNDDDIIFFCQNGLKELDDKYEIYISNNIKKINFSRTVSVNSYFKIGRDNILNCSLKVDDITNEELIGILEAERLKRKYYKLKNGDFVTINNNIGKVNNMLEELGINNKSIMLQEFDLPIYKTLYFKDYMDDPDYSFININGNLKEMLDRFDKYKNLDINLSKEDKNILRDYQIIGVKWLMTLSKCGCGGILADEMGLGKSIQTIMYINLKIKESKEKFIIITPTSLVYNWENEFKKFGKNIRYAVVNGNRNKREEILNNDNYDVIITTYGLLRQDLDLYSKYKFDTCIIDEAQNIKNVNTETTKAVKMINAKTKFALTGTPIENSVLELWSIFDYIMPNFLLPLTNFKKKYDDLDNKDLLLELNKKISPFILRRKKKDVLKDLPDKIENNIFIELSESQKKLYLGQLEKTKKEIDDTILKDGYNKSQILILSLLTKLRQICIDPRLMIDNNQLSSSKLETLIEILQSKINENHKILLFSQYPSALKLLIPDFDKNGISYYYLDGSTKSKERMELTNKFNNDDTNIFLISLKAGGTGLNLTSADVVIHLDPWWNPQVENQATDRSHRIGQKNVVEVIKLIAKDTIEEKIVELQNKKKILSDKIIEGEDRDNIVISKLTQEELKELLS